MLWRLRKPRNHALKLLNEANQARDTGQWAQAADAYRLYLTIEPRHAEIWVQLGHALKEIGGFRAADAAYTTAIDHAPDAADPHLHRGHLLKNLGRIEEAIEMLKRAHELDPDLIDAIAEVEHLEQSLVPHVSLDEFARDMHHLRAQIRQTEEKLQLALDQSNTIATLNTEVARICATLSDFGVRLQALENKNQGLKAADRNFSHWQERWNDLTLQERAHPTVSG